MTIRLNGVIQPNNELMITWFEYGVDCENSTEIQYITPSKHKTFIYSYVDFPSNAPLLFRLVAANNFGTTVGNTEYIFTGENMTNSTKTLYIISAAIIGFCFGMLDWDERIMVVCLSFVWIPIMVIYMSLRLINKFRNDIKKSLTDLKKLKEQ